MRKAVGAAMPTVTGRLTTISTVLIGRQGNGIHLILGWMPRSIMHVTYSDTHRTRHAIGKEGQQ
jgi:hypothetical protein